MIQLILIVSKRKLKYQHRKNLIFFRLGIIYDNLAKYNEALEAYEKALNIRIKIFG